MWIDFGADGEPEAAFKGAYEPDEAGVVRVDVGIGVELAVKMGDGRVGAVESSLGTGAVLWAAGPAMARALSKALLPADGLWGLRGRAAIELGAGCAGLPGTALALAGIASVVLTDTVGVVDALATNVEGYALTPGLNDDARGRLQRISARPLNWSDDDALAALARGAGYGLVVCADCDSPCDSPTSLHAPLIRTVCAALSAEPGSVALFCSGSRSESLLRDFLGLLAASLTVTEVSCDDGFANPLTAEAARALANDDGLRCFAARWSDAAAAHAARAAIAAASSGAGW